MKRNLLLTIAFCLFAVFSYAQVEGGAGIIYVTGDPNENANLVNVSTFEGNIAYNRSTQTLYLFNPSGTPYDGVTTGTQWVAISTSNLVESIATASGEDNLNITDDGNGNYEISFTSNATLSWDPTTNTLTYFDDNGTTTNLDLTGAVNFTDGNSTTVSGSGTDVDPYVIELTGVTDGMVPVGQSDGTLSWEKVVESTEVQGDGTILITFTDGTTSTLDLTTAPTVVNAAELNAAQANLASGTSGIVKAGAGNTFGLPATSDVGVLFFIKKD